MQSKFIQYKSTDQNFNSVLDVDDTSRRVKNVFSRTGIKDSDGDVIEKSAFAKTIQEWGPKNKNRIWHLTNHNSTDITTAVGKFSELYVDGDSLIGVTNIPNTTTGNDILELYKTGNITEHSIGFIPIQKETKNSDSPDSYTLIKEIQLFEGSSVLWGANEFTPNLSVGKSLINLSISEKEQLFKSLEEELLRFSITLSKGKFSEEMISFLQIGVKNVQTSIYNLLKSFTQSEENSIEPDRENKNDESFYKELLLLNTKLNLL